jgi:hypothetical protein
MELQRLRGAVEVAETVAATPSYEVYVEISRAVAAAYKPIPVVDSGRATTDTLVPGATIRGLGAFYRFIFLADHAAVEARSAASSAVILQGEYGRDYTLVQAREAVAMATEAAAGVPSSEEFVRQRIRADFDWLLTVCRDQGYTDATPVPPGAFGPMWPDGPPPGWPGEESDGEIVMELEVPEGLSDEEVARLASEAARHADAIYRAGGGRGLKVEWVEVRRGQPAPLPAGGPS